jgi:hypothetical protein
METAMTTLHSAQRSKLSHTGKLLYFFHQHNVIVKEQNWKEKKYLIPTNSRCIVPPCKCIILPP